MSRTEGAGGGGGGGEGGGALKRNGRQKIAVLASDEAQRLSWKAALGFTIAGFISALPLFRSFFYHSAPFYESTCAKTEKEGYLKWMIG